MKIYFEDGKLFNDAHNFGVPKSAFKINASEGYSENIYALKEAMSLQELNECDVIIYTNSLIALSNEYCWNDVLRVPELYIRLNHYEPFFRVDKLTDKEIRRPHNLMQMFMNGAFKNKE